MNRRPRSSATRPARAVRRGGVIAVMAAILFAVTPPVAAQAAESCSWSTGVSGGRDYAQVRCVGGTQPYRIYAICSNGSTQVPQYSSLYNQGEYAYGRCPSDFPRMIQKSLVRS